MMKATKQQSLHADAPASPTPLQAMLNSSLASLVLSEVNSPPRSSMVITSSSKVSDILNAVEDILGEEHDDNARLSSSLVGLLEPTPIAPHRAQIVDRVQVTENSWYEDEAYLLLLKPLLPKRKQIEELKSQQNPSKKIRLTHSKMVAVTPPTSITSLTATPTIASSNPGSNDHSRFRGYQAEQWNDRYEDLVVFCRTHGHCLVPHKLPVNPALAQWVKRQRYQHKLLLSGKHSTLTEERILALEGLGFVWDSHRAAWEERLDELRLFKAKHGHCNVPANFEGNPTLAIWIKCQRRQRRLYHRGEPSNMTEERIQKMDALGFLWNPRKGTE